MITKIEVSDIVIELDNTNSFVINDSFFPFITDKAVDYRIDLIEDNNISCKVGKQIYSGDCFEVYMGADEEQFIYFYDLKDTITPYAVGIYMLEDKKVIIQYRSNARKYFCETGNCFFHIAWENILLHENRIILHSSCIDTDLGGILFSGPSGIGKSTQADLWCQHEGAELINGDRTILAYKDCTWCGYGSPYAGSSKVYKNKSTAIRAIIMLAQGKNCKLKRLSIVEAFRKIYAQLTVNDWDRSYVQRIIELTELLLHAIPVYQFECTPDKKAVDILKSELIKEVDPWQK